MLENCSPTLDSSVDNIKVPIETHFLPINGLNKTTQEKTSTFHQTLHISLVKKPPF